jgi:hypothetical protein
MEALSIAGWIGLGWLGLALLVTAVLSAFFKGAHAAERALPATEAGLRAWVREGRHAEQRRSRPRAHPPAA